MFNLKPVEKMKESISKDLTEVKKLDEKPGEVIAFSEKKEQQEYAEVIKLKDELYDSIIEQNPEVENMRTVLENHEIIVQGYGNELIEAHPNLSLEEKVTVKLAIIFHDTGKLVNLLEHHKKGAENAEKILRQLKDHGKKIEGIEISEEIIEKVKQAIDRHMNHPFLVDKNGGRFPEPESEVDKIVFDADILANVGFKNVCFRLIVPDFIKEDTQVAKQKGITVLEASFNNVMEGIGGVRTLDKVVLTDPAKEKIGMLIKSSEVIFEYFRENNIFEKVEKEFSGDQMIGKQPKLIKKRLNEEIAKAGAKLGIDKKIFNNFKI